MTIGAAKVPRQHVDSYKVVSPPTIRREKASVTVRCHPSTNVQDTAVIPAFATCPDATSHIASDIPFPAAEFVTPRKTNHRFDDAAILRASTARNHRPRDAEVCRCGRISSRSNPPRKCAPRWSPAGWSKGSRRVGRTRSAPSDNRPRCKMNSESLAAYFSRLVHLNALDKSRLPLVKLRQHGEDSNEIRKLWPLRNA